MNNHLRLIAAAVATLAMSQVSAQSYGNSGYAPGAGYGYGHSQRVRCESVHSRRTYCRLDVQGTVRLTRQLSHSACVQGRTWAADSRGLWVSNGCRADFAISTRRRYRGNDGYSSNDYNDGSRYDNQNGYRNDSRSDSDYGNTYQTGGDRYDSGYSTDSARVIRCDSTSDGRTYCRNESNGAVRLSRTFGGDCREGQTWGSDSRGIWVSGDCDASFNVYQDGSYDRDSYQQ